uniref:Transmembrane protein n=1 Tax=Panagrellus redivivus TaxID=6233 RepID=A0A7E4VC85_PANRE
MSLKLVKLSLFCIIISLFVLVTTVESKPMGPNVGGSDTIVLSSPFMSNCFFSPMNCIPYKSGELRRIVVRRARF